MNEMAPLPHEDYIVAVFGALAELGVTPKEHLVTTPDGEVLDGVISFFRPCYSIDEWPDGVYLGWDQREGWSLCNEGENRNLYPLDLDTYAHPRAVARRAADRLLGGSDQSIDEWSGPWRGGEEIEAAVTAWEAS